MSYKDHFSSVASGYAAFRPHYPPALFSWLAENAPSRDTAWDCACGNGQASIGLSHHFARVLATDASEAQIKATKKDKRIEYRVATAEQSGLPSHAADCLTVAQALHWFDLEAFYREARRVVKPKGLIAVWCCGSVSADDPLITDALQKFHRETLGPYWPPETTLVDNAYRTILFPFEELSVPKIPLEMSWHLSEVMGYFRTFSAIGRFTADKGSDPVESFERDLLPLWGDPDQRRMITWPFHIRAGRV